MGRTPRPPARTSTTGSVATCGSGAARISQARTWLQAGLLHSFTFVTRSCAPTKEMIKLDDGRELPLIKLETTSETHPFYTGTQKSVDNLGGRVEKFRNKFARVGLKK